MFKADPPPFDWKDAIYWVTTQFLKLEDETRHVKVPVLHAAPLVPEQDTLIIADGTDWDPGAGRGLYFWTGAAWEKL